MIGTLLATVLVRRFMLPAQGRRDIGPLAAALQPCNPPGPEATQGRGPEDGR